MLANVANYCQIMKPLLVQARCDLMNSDVERKSRRRLARRCAEKFCYSILTPPRSIRVRTSEQDGNGREGSAD